MSSVDEKKQTGRMGGHAVFPVALGCRGSKMFPEGTVSLKSSAGSLAFAFSSLRDYFKSAPEASLCLLMNQLCNPFFLGGFTWMSIRYPRF